MAEGIARQFYLAILVARLVGMQMSHRRTRQIEEKVEDTEEPTPKLSPSEELAAEFSDPLTILPQVF